MLQAERVGSRSICAWGKSVKDKSSGGHEHGLNLVPMRNFLKVLDKNNSDLQHLWNVFPALIPAERKENIAVGSKKC